MALCPPSGETPFPPRGFIAGPNINPVTRITLESNFGFGVLRLIGGYGNSSVDMGPRRDTSIAVGVVLIGALGAVRAGKPKTRSSLKGPAPRSQVDGRGVTCRKRVPPRRPHRSLWGGGCWGAE